MNLDQYLNKRCHPRDDTPSITVRTFAKELNVTSIYLSAIRHGIHKCSKKLAEAIERATKGEVTKEELMKQMAWKKRHGIPIGTILEEK